MILLAVSATSSDSGAGAQMDVKTSAALGVYCASAITAVTAQNTKKVSSVFCLPVREVEKQLESVLSDFDVRAVKVGLIGDAGNFALLARKLRGKKIVLDPVMGSQSDEKSFVGEKHLREMKKFMKSVFLITANAEECEKLCGVRAKEAKSAKKAAYLLKKMGAKNVLVKGVRNGKLISDYLFAGESATQFEKPLVRKGTHGGGCMLSTAIAANIARGMSVSDAVWDAEFFAQRAIEDGMKVGKGIEIVKPG